MKKLFFLFFFTFNSILIFSQNWQQINGINSIPVKNLAILNDRIFVNYLYGDIYYSDNDGIDWINANVPYSTSSIVVFKSKIYIIGLVGFIGVGLFESDDNGITWTQITDSNMDYAFNMCASEDYLYVSTGFGLYRSANGQDWTFLNNGAEFETTSHMGAYKNKVWVHNLHTEYSDDAGLTWVTLTNSYGIDYACMNDSLLFASTGPDIYYCETVNNWISITKNLPIDISVYKVESNDLGLFISSNKGVYYLSDITSTWIKLDNGAIFSREGQFEFYGNKIFYGLKSSTGIYYRADLFSDWESRNNEFNFSNVESFFKHDDLYAAIVDNKLFISINYGKDWNCFYIEGLKTPSVYDPQFEYFKQELIISSNIGLIKYNTIDSTLNIDSTSPFFWHLEVDNNRLYGSTFSGLCYTEDLDSAWTYFNDSLVLCYIINFKVTNGNIYTSSSDHGIVFSNDSGITWQHISQGLYYYYDPFYNDTSYNVASDFIITDTSLTILTDYISYATYDYSNNIWEYHDLNIPTSIIDHPSEFGDLLLIDNILYLASSLGVYKTDINNINWININNEIDQFHYLFYSKRAKRLYSFDDSIYVSIENASVWKTASDNNNNVLNLNYSTEINVFPNPTTGKITIEAEGMESVEVYNLQGQKIPVIARKNDEAISHNQTRLPRYARNDEIDLSSQPKGIYIIKVQTSRGVAVEKVVLE